MNEDFGLRAISVGLERDGIRVLAGVSLRAAPGEITAVVGPSGAGKSSLLRCLNGLNRPCEGRVLLDGRDIAVLDPVVVRRRVGMLFQTPVLFEGSVAANLRYGLDHPEESDLRGALEIVGLPPELLERPGSALSVGQGQRVCLARALLRGPEVLLADEPTSALDKDAGATIEKLLIHIAKEGVGVVMVTHDLEQARRLADSAVLLVEGRVAGEGPPNELVEMWPSEESP